MIISPEQKRWDEEAKINSDLIESKINSLENILNSEDTKNSKDISDLYREVNNLFRDLKPLRKNDQRNLWTMFSKVRDGLKPFLEKETDSREVNSSVEQEIILGMISEIKELPVTEGNREEAEKFQSKLKAAIDELQKKAGRMIGSHTHACWTEIKEVKKKVNSVISDLQKTDFEKALVSLESAKETVNEPINPFDAANKIKELRSSTKGLYLNRNQTNHLKKEFDEIWGQISAKIDAFKEEKKRKHEDWLKRREKQEEWQSKQKDRAGFIEKRVARLQELIVAINNEIGELEEKKATARTSEFELKCEKWIEEKRTKLADFQRTLSELQAELVANPAETRTEKIEEKPEEKSV